MLREIVCAVLALTSGATPVVTRAPGRVGSQAVMMGAVSAQKIAIVVEVEIEPSRLDEFLRVIEADAIGSRERENGGCLRFDVARDLEKPNVFRFYELYASSEAVAFHKSTPHFALWKEFKASGGVISQTASMNEGLFVG
jgi:quinol monooxygenase YgiN